MPVTKEFELVAPMPKPAKLYIPEWYKQIPATKDIEFRDGNLINDIGAVKRCMPFLDSLTTGYIQESWCDIHIHNRNNIITYTHSAPPTIMAARDRKALTISEKYYALEFTWRMPWAPKLPKGYSAMYTHPLNRIDLPFTTTSGIVDSDLFFHTSEGGGNYPFYIEKDFEGIIPAGTPMYQIIPIKRESWKSSPIPFNEDDSIRRDRVVRRHFFNSYKKQFWQKKSYE